MRRAKPSKVTADSFAAVIRAFLASPKFGNLAGSTRDHYARALQIAARPDTLGSLSVEEIRPSLVQAHLDGYGDRAGAQSVALTALKSLERWAIVRDLLPRHITTGIELIGGGGGHEPWLTEHIELAERHAPPALGRAVILASNTGQRGSDLVRMRFTDIEHYEGRPGINVITQKTGRILWVPMTQELIRAMERWERRPGHIIVGPGGGPITRDRLSRLWQRERDENRALAPLKALGLTFHGLRSTAVIRLRRAGVSKPLIADMVGLSGPMVDRYCRLSEQRANALAALDLMQGTTREQAEVIPFKKPDDSGT